MTDRLTRQLLDPSRSNAALLALLFEGQRSVRALAEFLRTSRPSSIAEGRLLAVEGLSILKGPEALDVLIEVATEPLAEIPDPAIRLAEEAVVSRAARALAEFTEPRAREALLSLLDSKPLRGVAEAFEKLKDTRAIGGLVAWLEDDFVADAAQRAIVALGRVAAPELLRSLRERHERYGAETRLSLRRRARILEILAEFAEPEEMGEVESLLLDPTELTRSKAVRVLLGRGNNAQKRSAFQAGLDLLDSSDNLVRGECEELLTAHFESGADLVEEAIRSRRKAGESENALQIRETALQILLRIHEKGSNSTRVSR